MRACNALLERLLRWSFSSGELVAEIGTEDQEVTNNAYNDHELPA